ncbi:unnamed protein product [Brassica napus]|uniref:(rape) hypothetical protein n=1 Tax=Brassica napus TaxID=3708 RepID=A0A816RBR5_BRANA|nr:unnamed protein product [Brassica napus]
MLLGKKISIARSNPKKGKKDFSRRGNEGSGNSKNASQVSDKAKASLGGETEGEKRGNEVEVRGKNTFAVPRNNEKRFGFINTKLLLLHSFLYTPKPIAADDTPKSNDEFRNMFLKK